MSILIPSDCDIFITNARVGHDYLEKLVLRTGVSNMRLIAILAVLSTFLAVGGCFHHSEVYTAEPIELPPLK